MPEKHDLPGRVASAFGALRLFSTPGYPPARPRYWLHVLLFLLTLLSTTIVGVVLAADFSANRPPFSIDLFDAPGQVVRNPAALLTGLPFSLTLLTILMAHEMGHYIACVFYRIDASLPYFLPAPTFIGTLGALIRIRSPIYTRRVLFDVGVAGPLAGFVFLIPALGFGLAYSKIVPGIAKAGDLVFGTPLLLRFLEQLVFTGVSGEDIYLHPVARAAWVGLLATALNLLPIGQLDGGHILYALIGEKHRMLSRFFVALLVPLAPFFWWGWLVWAVLLFFFGMRHPAIYDARELGGTRKRLAALALVIFLLCLTLTPVALSDS